MPSIASHYAVCTRVSKLLGTSSLDFYKGNILPDLVDYKNSHYKIQGKYFLIPNISSFLEKNKLDNDLNKGYLCHLLLDKYFLEDYIVNVKDYDKDYLFCEENIYEDYSNMNKKIVDHFNIDLNKVNLAIDSLKDESDYKKYLVNKESINLTITKELKFINLENYINFLESVSNQIYRDIIDLAKD